MNVGCAVGLAVGQTTSKSYRSGFRVSAGLVQLKLTHAELVLSTQLTTGVSGHACTVGAIVGASVGE